MVDKHGIVVECAYDQLEKKLNKGINTFDVEKKGKFMIDAFQQFLKDIRQ